MASCHSRDTGNFRSRVIAGYSRDTLLSLYFSIAGLDCNGYGDMRPGGDDDIRFGSRTGFLGVLAPSVSIKDRWMWQC